MKIEKLVRVVSDLRGQGKDVVLVSSARHCGAAGPGPSQEAGYPC